MGVQLDLKLYRQDMTMRPNSSDVVDQYFHSRWRVRLLIVSIVFGLGAVWATASGFIYGTWNPTATAFLWLGMACVLLAWWHVPSTLGDRRGRRLSALFVVAGGLFYLAVPLLLLTFLDR